MGKIDSAFRSAGRQVCLLQLSIPIISHFGHAPAQFETTRSRPPRFPLRLPFVDEECDRYLGSYA